MRTAELPRYMFRRGNILYLRLQPPGQPVVEKSLGTSDVKAAEIAAADLIKQHKTILYERRLARLPRLEQGAWAPQYQPGLHDGFFATERQLLDRETGAVIGPNGTPHRGSSTCQWAPSFTSAIRHGRSMNCDASGQCSMCPNLIAQH